MAFATQDDVFAVLEDVLPPIFAKYGKYDIASAAPFRRIPYREAMEVYGTDKPDLRIDLILQDVTGICAETEFGPFQAECVKAVVVSGCKLARKAIDKLCAEVGGPGRGKGLLVQGGRFRQSDGGVSKFLQDRKEELTAALGLKPGDFVGFTAGKSARRPKTAGKLRSKLGQACEGHGRRAL